MDVSSFSLWSIFDWKPVKKDEIKVGAITKSVLNGFSAEIKSRAQKFEWLLESSSLSLIFTFAEQYSTHEFMNERFFLSHSDKKEYQRS